MREQNPETFEFPNTPRNYQNLTQNSPEHEWQTPNATHERNTLAQKTDHNIWELNKHYKMNKFKYWEGFELKHRRNKIIQK